MESRIADPADPTRIFSWLTCQSYDDKGNAIVYTYAAENSDGVDFAQVHEKNRTPASRSANRHLQRIHYGNRHPNRDAEWNAKVREVFEELKKDGTLSKLSQKWIGADISK